MGNTWHVAVKDIKEQPGGSHQASVSIKTPDARSIALQCSFGQNYSFDEARYRALAEGLDLVRSLGGKSVWVISETPLLITHIKLNPSVLSPALQSVWTRLNKLIKAFDSFFVQWVPSNLITSSSEAN